MRAIALSKLHLSERAVCYDIGAGTGSVAIEMALQAKKGRIFAIERRADAVELLKKNQAAFSAENLTIVAGSAPEACDDLPAPTHAFIGGSAGNLHGILAVLLQKNPQVRIVATGGLSGERRRADGVHEGISLCGYRGRVRSDRPQP